MSGGDPAVESGTPGRDDEGDGTACDRNTAHAAGAPNSVCERDGLEAPNVSAHRGHKTLVAFAASGTCSRYTLPSLITHLMWIQEFKGDQLIHDG